MRNKKFDEARIYLRNVFQSIQIAYDTHKRLPDGRNHIESVVRLIASKQKSIFYEDKTSHLIGILFEFLAVLNMEEEYTYLREYFKAIPLYCALFVPYDDKKLSDLFPNENKNHELHLFSHELRQEGYQSEIILDESFSIFKEKTLKKTEFSYEYRTSKAGYPFLLTLTHTYFKTPVFPNEWRKFAEIPKQNELKHEEETASKT